MIVYLFLLTSFFSKTFSFDAKSIVSFQSDNWGDAYLSMVDNQTAFPLSIYFPKSDSAPEFDPVVYSENLKKFKEAAAKGSSEEIERSLNSFYRELPAGSYFGKVLAGDGAAIVQNVLAPFLTIGLTSLAQTGPFSEIKDSKINKKPVVSGFAKSEISGFMAGQTLLLSPLRGRGGVWMVENDFEISSSVSFKLYAQDKGKIAVSFSADEKDETPSLQFVFGDMDNSAMSVYLKGELLSRVKASDYPDISLAPGRFKDFWIAFSLEEYVFVGASEAAGQNVLFCQRIPGLAGFLRRMGFQSFDDPVAVSSVVLNPPVKITLLKDQQKFFSLGTEEPVRFWRTGGGAFLLTRSMLATLKSIEVLDTDGGSFVLSAPSPSELKLENIKKKLSISSSLGEEDKDFLLNVDGNFFSILAVRPDGSLAPKLVCVDPAFQKAEFLKFDKLKQDAKFTEENVSSYPSAAASLDLNAGFGLSAKKVSFSGRMTVVRPFIYEFSQRGPAIVCSDKIFNESFILGSASQQNAVYSFKLTIKPSGNIDLKWQFDQPVNPTRFGLKMAVGALRFAEAQMFFKADQIPDEEEPSLPAQIKKTVQNIAYSLTGASFRTAAGLAEAQLLGGFRDDTGFLVNNDQQTTHDISVSVSKQAQLNTQIVNQKLQILSSSSLNSRAEFDFFVGEYKNLVNLINDSSIATPAVKLSIQKDVKKILDSRDAIKNINSEKNDYGQDVVLAKSGIDREVLSLILSIIQNNYLMQQATAEGQLFKKQLYDNLFQISSSYFFTKSVPSNLEMPITGDVALWSAKTLPKGEGLVVLEATGTGDLGLLFAEESLFNAYRQRPLVQGDSLFEVCIGEERNRYWTLRDKYATEPLLKKKTVDEEDNLLNNLEPRSYWVNFYKDRITFGCGDVGFGKILEKERIKDSDADLVLGILSNGENNQIKNIFIAPSLDQFDPVFLKFIQDPSGASMKLADSASGFSDVVIKNAQGMVVVKGDFKESSEINFFFQSEKFDLLYGLKILIEGSSASYLITDLVNEVDIKSGDFSAERAGDGFWLDLDSKVLSFGFGDFWKNDPFSAFVSAFFETDIKISMDVALAKNLKAPVNTPTRKLLDYALLNFLSKGKIPVSKDDSAVQLEKEQAAADEVVAIMKELKQQDPLLKDLKREDMNSFTDIIALTAFDDDYANYMLDQMDLRAMELRQGQDVLTSDVLVRDDSDFAKSDLLSSSIDVDRNEAAGHEERGSVKKLAAQGMAGIGAQLKQELEDLKSVNSSIVHGVKSVLFKVSDGKYGYSSKEEMDDADQNNTGLGLGRDFRKLKRELGSLFGGAEDYRTEVVNEKNFKTKIERDASGNATPVYQQRTDAAGNKRKVFANVFREFEAITQNAAKKIAANSVKQDSSVQKSDAAQAAAPVKKDAIEKREKEEDSPEARSKSLAKKAGGFNVSAIASKIVELQSKVTRSIRGRRNSSDNFDNRAVKASRLSSMKNKVVKVFTPKSTLPKGEEGSASVKRSDSSVANPMPAESKLDKMKRLKDSFVNKFKKKNEEVTASKKSGSSSDGDSAKRSVADVAKTIAKGAAKAAKTTAKRLVGTAKLAAIPFLSALGNDPSTDTAWSAYKPDENSGSEGGVLSPSPESLQGEVLQPEITSVEAGEKALKS